MNGETITVNYDLSDAKTLKNRLEYFKHIRTFIFDVDGVMTDGTIQSTDAGEFLRTFHTRDGYAISQAVKEKFNIVVITGGRGNSIENRLKYLGIHQFYTGVGDKLPVFQRFIETHNLNLSEILYMGDDINDLAVMSKVGLACCPADACPEIQEISHYVSPFNGGKGCVRDVIEKVMKLRGNWMNHISISS
jgi:3-deoxy-D-manno-octulosonate 8-phosphate phosphatase (KDO 8-P phosphatase)